MNKPKKLNDKQIKKAYKLLNDYHKKFLKNYGVKLPALKNTKGGYIKDTLVLIYLSQDYPKTRRITKS